MPLLRGRPSTSTPPLDGPQLFPASRVLYDWTLLGHRSYGRKKTAFKSRALLAEGMLSTCGQSIGALARDQAFNMPAQAAVLGWLPTSLLTQTSIVGCFALSVLSFRSNARSFRSNVPSFSLAHLSKTSNVPSFRSIAASFSSARLTVRRNAACFRWNVGSFRCNVRSFRSNRAGECEKYSISKRDRFHVVPRR